MFLTPKKVPKGVKFKAKPLFVVTNIVAGVILESIAFRSKGNVQYFYSFAGRFYDFQSFSLPLESTGK